jgi:hypothetical protein
MPIQIGNTVPLNTSQTAQVIEVTTLFGQAYANVFIEPHGPTPVCEASLAGGRFGAETAQQGLGFLPKKAN